MDKIASYTGEGSFSDSMIAWKDECVTLREQIPAAFASIDGARFFEFHQYQPIKDTLLKVASESDLDLMLFHHHGTPNRQWLQSWHGKEKPDSLQDASLGVLLPDIRRASPSARLLILDACYNGDFREDDFVANEYIFSDGGSVAAIGNTVNVLQDKHSSHLLGMLTQGYSVGEWHQMTAILESHVIGDPTLRFRSGFARPDLFDSSQRHWRKVLGRRGCPDDIKALALTELDRLGAKGMPRLLFDTFTGSDGWMLRLECMELLSRYDSDLFPELLRLALDDPYEYIRRKAATYLSKRGDASDIGPLVNALLLDRNAKRVVFNITENSAYFPDSLFLQAYRNAVKETGFVHERSDSLGALNGALNLRGYFSGAIGKTGSSSPGRLRMLKGMRNYNYPQFARDLVSIVGDGSEPLQVRVTAAEALGWFTSAWNRREIADNLKEALGKGLPEELEGEVRKSVARLNEHLK